MPRWLFAAAALIPCLALLAFCGLGIHEAWLIGTQQIAVTPAPTPGAASLPEVSAWSLMPLIFGAGALAAAFATALVRGSRRMLAGAYLALVAVVGLAVVRHADARNMDCKIGPVKKTYADSAWLVYSCTDGKSVVFIAAEGSAAAPYIFVAAVDAASGKRGFRGEGTGNQKAVEPAGKRISALSEKDYAALVQATKKVKKGP